MELELRGIEKSFREKHVLNDISLSIKSGSALGLLGRNGAGKTTTIRILMDVFPADRGEIYIDGQAIDYSKISIGYLPEERGLYPKKVIFEQLVYFAMLKGMKKAAAKKAVDFWLDKLEMSEYRNKKLDTLSKGNQQKIQLITTVVHDPDIIILDEPFSGLDPVNAMLLKDVVREEIQNGKIVLFSSHQMNYVEEFCENIAILNGGKIVLQGSLRDIKRDYKRDKLMVRSQQADKILADLGECCEMQEYGELLVCLSSETAKPEMMQRLIENYDIDEIKVREPSLNDIFVEYAGDQE